MMRQLQVELMRDLRGQSSWASQVQPNLLTGTYSKESKTTAREGGKGDPDIIQPEGSSTPCGLLGVMKAYRQTTHALLVTGPPRP